ncbi:MAG: metallophosphoesterase [Planctomycetota bacterium]
MHRFPTAALLLSVLAGPVAAHEDGHEDGHTHAATPPSGAAATDATAPPPARGVALGDIGRPEQQPPGQADGQPDGQLDGMTLPLTAGPRPWTGKPVLNGPDRFQIAIVTDRTGGHRPGVWLDAMRKLNLMRPEFVVSVGDLIEGYTEDRDQLEREWAEFLGLVGELDMRFFFVPGNHDVILPEMLKLWREKFGADWYSFDYRGVHFVCLNSEDTRNQIGPRQLAWLEEDLADHADARWTLVFVHKPLWTYSERARGAGNPDETGWPEVERMLAGRPHTVFAGHVHHYMQYQRNGGRRYYSLATTGGGSRLRGDAYGEFDHVVWLTMEPEGPRLAVLKLDGILPPGVVTEESAERFGRFLRQVRLEVAPVLIDADPAAAAPRFAQGEVEVTLTNGFGEAVAVAGTIDGLPLAGLTLEPAELRLQAGPGGAASQRVRLRFAQPIALDRLTRATLTATLTTTAGETGATNTGDANAANGARLRAEVVAPVVIDRRHACPAVDPPPAIDGLAEPLPTPSYATPAAPLLLGDAAGWKGPADASLRLHASHDEQRLYFALRVQDERLAAGDRVELLLDGRPPSRRREEPRLDGGTCRVIVPAPPGSRAPEPQASEVPAPDGGGAAAVWNARRPRPVDGAVARARRAPGGYTVEVSLPVEVVASGQGAGWKSFRLAVVQHDADEPGAEPTRVLWRGSPSVDETNAGYGYFLREPGSN